MRIGYELVCSIAFSAGLAEIVLTRHKRYDGTGYPQGLRGDEIPLLARIFTVADTRDAMTSNRPYQRALSYSADFSLILRSTYPNVLAAELSLFLRPRRTLGRRYLLERIGRRPPRLLLDLFALRHFFGFARTVYARCRRSRRLFDAGPFAQGFC